MKPRPDYIIELSVAAKDWHAHCDHAHRRTPPGGANVSWKASELSDLIMRYECPLCEWKSRLFVDGLGRL